MSKTLINSVVILILTAGITSAQFEYIGDYNTEGVAVSSILDGNYLFVADGGAGLIILDISNPSNPLFIGSYDTPGNAQGLAISGDYAFIADGNYGLHIVNISDPYNPVYVGDYDTPGDAVDLVIQEDSVSGDSYAYICDNYEGLLILDVSNPNEPAYLGNYNTDDTRAYDIEIVNNIAYIAAGYDGGLHIIDVSLPEAPFYIGGHDAPFGLMGIDIEGSYAFGVDARYGLYSFYIVDPTEPQFISNFDTPGVTWGLSVSNDIAYIRDRRFGLYAIDVIDPLIPILSAYYYIPESAQYSGIFSIGNDVYLSEQYDGIMIFKYHGEMQFGVINGTVTDSAFNPIEGLIVSTSTYLEFCDTTNGQGEYELNGLLQGNYNINFLQYTGPPYYCDSTIIGVPVTANDTTNLNITLLPSESPVTIWAGNPDGSPIVVPIGQWADIPIYCQTADYVYVRDIRYPLGAKKDLIVEFDALRSSSDYWPFNTGYWGWVTRYFGYYNDDIDHGYPGGTNSPGYHSLSFNGFNQGLIFGQEYLHSEIPIQILSFRVRIADSLELAGQTIYDALEPGVDPWQGPANCGDTLGGPGYRVYEYFSPVKFISYKYVLGDANMYLGDWPPVAIGGDVTYLINYFRSFPSSQACPIDGFWASADVNGDCIVIGSDVTRLVNYFKGNIDLDYCPDYPSMWPSPGDIPEEAPEGWPNCE